MTSGNGQHCSFALLAEFHLLEGAKLKYQFPQPLGVDEGVLAMSMLPDGAEAHIDDWTIFFLNQTSFNTISPVLALDSEENLSRTDAANSPDGPGLLCVLNLVRTTRNEALKRGGMVVALAICTRHPFIQIFKPILLIALDDYMANPSQDCLARLFDAINSMDLTGAPVLSRFEKMVMRASERKNVFSEKFTSSLPQPTSKQHKSTNSTGSYSSFEEGLMMRVNSNSDKGSSTSRDRSDTAASHDLAPPDDTSFSLGGSAVWVGDESVLGDTVADTQSVTSSTANGTATGSSGKRRSTDASSSSSFLKERIPTSSTAMGSQIKDTHFFHTTVYYKDHRLPIKMPLATFPEEVGDYSLITLIKVFSSSQLVTGPQHPHLHTNGPLTHPVIILFNALVTGKRIIFLGHKRPAGEVASFVLSACALGSGCGAVLRGFVERAFPYANLKNRDEWELVPAYIAGVTNPIFQSSRAWDLLLDIPTGTLTVAKDIHATYPITPIIGFGGPLISRAGTLKAENSIGSDDGQGKDGAKNDFVGKSDHNVDNLFIEDVKSAIEYHFGEGLVRMRFTEYVIRFVRLASRYEEEVTGETRFGYTSAPFMDGTATRGPTLGSGITFGDDALGMRELTANAHRLEAWRQTKSYEYCVQDFLQAQATDPIAGFDLIHQLFKLRHGRMNDAEVGTLMKTFVDNVKTYEQVVELLAYTLPHAGGLTQLAFGLFHQHAQVRASTVELFDQLRAYPVGALYLQALNHFQRYAYVRQAHERERKVPETGSGNQQLLSPPSSQAYTPGGLSTRSYSGSSGTHAF